MWARCRNRWILLAVALALAAVPTAAWMWDSGRDLAADGVFAVKPYVQWGAQAHPGSGSAEGFEVLWEGVDRDEHWSLEVAGDDELQSGSGSRSRSEAAWIAVGPPTMQRIELEGITPRRLYRASVPAVGSGSVVRYRLRRGGEPVFEARARAAWTEPHEHRFVVFGDGGADTSEQRAVAYQAYQARPDFVLLTGDLVYYKGSFHEYLHHFFPVYNNDTASPRTGAPLLRSTLVLAAAGNHDLIERDLNRCPDGLAFYLLWSLPLNGPPLAPGAANTPILVGQPERKRAYIDRAGPAFPRMANYAFDYGGAHWVVLDTNAYADWTDPALRGWLESDLSSDAARGATWRFVAFHQPPFHTGKAHAEEQRSRVLAELFEKANVDIVFCGHVHNYQRTYPLRFTAAAGRPAAGADGRVAGRWTLDRAYDGVKKTRPDGVIYVISGAGGARLYSREQHDDDASWEEFTARFIANTHSLTVVDVAPERLTLRQVSARGDELDRFVVTRGAPGATKPAP